MKRRVETSDRFWLLTLGMTALVGLIVLGVIAEIYGIEEQAAVLLGTIVGGLLMFMREIVQAIRTFWTEERTGKLTDQLAAAPPPGPIDANITNASDNPVPVEAQK